MFKSGESIGLIRLSSFGQKIIYYRWFRACFIRNWSMWKGL